MNMKQARRYAESAAYFLASIRYAGLVVPFAVAAFLSGWYWLFWATLAVVALTLIAEVFTAGALAVQDNMNRRFEDELFDTMFKDAERHANGGWVGLGDEHPERGLDGSESTDEEDGGEGQVPVPAPPR